MPDVVMPKLSDTMEEGKILRWLKRKGDPIEAGEVLVEVETDKADMEVESTHSGTLREIRLSEGESAPVGAVIAVVGDATDATDSGDGKSLAPREPEARPAKGQDTEVAQDARDDAGAEEETDADLGADDDQAEDPAPRARGRDGGGVDEPEAEMGGQDEGQERAEAKSSARPAKEATQPSARGRSSAPPPRGRPRISPLAQKRAAELGVDPANIRGTGPAGRVMRSDVEAQSGAKSKAGTEASGRAARERAAEPKVGSEDRAPAKASREPDRAGSGGGESARPPRPQGQRPPAGEPGSGTVKVRAPVLPSRQASASPAQARSPRETAGASRRVPLTSMRASIARRMAESKREAPHFYVTTIIDMDLAVRLRAGLKDSGTTAAGVTVNHLVIKAAADALVAVPELNARFAGEAIEVMEEVHIGVATSVPDGLIVPVIHNADRLDLAEIAERARELGEKARNRSFGSDDLSGATFTVSNLGMYGVDSFIAVINPPQAAILAVGAVKQAPVVRDGALAVGHVMALTLSCDHRSVDGARAGEFLAEVRRRLENPTLLLFPAAAEEA